MCILRKLAALSPAFPVLFLVLPYATGAPQAPSPFFEAEQERVQDAVEADMGFFVVSFNIHLLFWNEESLQTLDAGIAEQYEDLIDTVEAAGLVPIGTLPVWVFPPSAQPSLVPQRPGGLLQDSPEARFACVPPFGSLDYLRMLESHQLMQARVAEEFPDIRFWVMGLDFNLDFFDCEGYPLDVADTIRFTVENMKVTRDGIKSSDPNNIAIAHFLGRSWNPIVIQDEAIQPLDFLLRSLAEIGRTGSPITSFFDFHAVLLEPELLLPRTFDNPGTAPVERDSSGYQSSCFETVQNPVPGYNEKCREEFVLLEGVDLSAYPAWDKFPTSSYVVSMPTSGGDSRWALVPPPPDSWKGVVAGVYSHYPPSATVPNFIPEEYEFNGTETEKDQWLAHYEYRAVLDIKDGDEWNHTPMCLRATPRPLGPDEDPDFTRFCSWVYAKEIAQPPADGTCVPNEPCGGAQFYGIPLNDPGSPVTAQKIFHSSATGSTFPPDGRIFRSQMIEKKRFSPWRTWERVWEASVWDVTDPGNVPPPLFRSLWHSDTELRGEYGIETPATDPDLAGSRISPGFGIAPSGRIDVERIATYFFRF